MRLFLGHIGKSDSRKLQAAGLYVSFMHGAYALLICDSANGIQQLRSVLERMDSNMTSLLMASVEE